MYFWAHNLLCILHTLAFTFLCSVLLLAAIATYRLVLHPLSQVPGPRLAAVSNVWYAYHVRNGSSFRLAKVLHKQYGPVVRVGPNEVWVNSADGFRSIYGEWLSFMFKGPFVRYPGSDSDVHRCW